MHAALRSIVMCLMLLVGGLLAAPPATGTDATPIPADAIVALEAMVSTPQAEASAARRRLATKRAIRQAEDLIEAHPEAANRYEVLSILFRAQQALLALEESSANRAAILDTCRKLAAAPDEYAELRLDADLLLSQAEVARQGGDGEARMQALKPLLARYRDTPAEARTLRVATMLALELGEQRLIDELRQVMEVRFAGDPEMIEFMRENLGGQVFGAPFCGVFETSSGERLAFPLACLGRTTLLYFWSQEEGGGENLARLAAAWREIQPKAEGRLLVLSLNLDDLPDAGVEILRAAAADWTALRLPGGRDHPAFRAFGRSGASIVTVSPTGYGAIIMAGSTRRPPQTEGLPDYGRMFGSALAREWTEPDYLAQLVSLLTGEFLVIPAVGPFDASRPPELAAIGSADASLARTDTSVPEPTLNEIQACFTPPPARYRQPLPEARAAYEQAVDLCRRAIAAHPEAADLWIVRNRLIVSLLGLWKTASEQRYFDEAVTESRAAVSGKAPPGTDIVPRLCLAQSRLRDINGDPKAAVPEFLASLGEMQESGPALAAAVILALGSGDRSSYEACRHAILEKHTDNPMMWTMVAFLLDRHHQYRIFQAPFTAGWTPGRRAKYFMSSGDSEEVHRTLRAELQLLDGGSFRIPEDARGKWTAIIFAAPWSKEGPPSPESFAKRLSAFADTRPAGDVSVRLAVLDDDAEKVKGLIGEKPFPCPVMLVPGGTQNPLARQLGILEEHRRYNTLLLRPDGSIAVFLSGLTMQRGGEEGVSRLIEYEDEQAVVAALERGQIDEAKRLAFSLAPPPESNPTDPQARRTQPPKVSLHHLRARARVFIALEDWDRALADAEALVEAETAISGGLSMRTAALDEAEELRALILRRGRASR